MIKVRVPATSANLGSGFDCFGLALALYAEVGFEQLPSGYVIEGCPEKYQNETNLVYRAYCEAMKAMSRPVDGVKITIDSKIPIARGLGSSAALLVCGVLGANAMHGNPLSKQACFELCTSLEGHPDNVAPALFGGCVASVMDEDKPISVSFDVHPDWNILALIPDFHLSTKQARSVLPETVSFKDAVFNLSRSALLGKAISLGDPRLLKVATQDRLHQPYRSSLIHDFEGIVERIQTIDSTVVFLSGAGPTILIMSDREDLDETIRPYLINLRNQWEIVPLQIDTDGAIIETK
ncbi:MAG: homoserine kinase [Erysipelotrichaceae bacterium]